MRLFSLFSYGTTFINIFLGLTQLSKQGALQKKKCPSELSAFEKKRILQDTISSLQHSPLFQSTQYSFELQPTGGKEDFRKIRKIYKKTFMFIKDHHRVLQQYVAEHSANFNNVLKQERVSKIIKFLCKTTASVSTPRTRQAGSSYVLFSPAAFPMVSFP